MRMENSYENNTQKIREHFKKLCKEHDNVWKLKVRHFETLFQCFDPTLNELKFLCDSLVKASKRLEVILLKL